MIHTIYQILWEYLSLFSDSYTSIFQSIFLRYHYLYIYQNGFYNSSANNNQEIAYIGSFAGKFICTETFTKETLPIGSVIVVDSGYQYRPDAWVGDEINNNRPNNVTTNVVVVDEAWWGDYTIKGFNISRLDSTDISQTPYETTSHFRIYIPKM